MNHHPYLRAYMAGIIVPTLLLLVAVTVFTVLRLVWKHLVARLNAIIGVA